MSTVFLVSCVKKKTVRPRAAADLYVSDWFRKARAYILSRMVPGDRWYILSAKHHLVEPTRVLEPYEETLNAMGRRERLVWADRVLGELRGALKSGDRLVILAGEKYRQFLEPALRASGFSVEVPMRGLPIGRQLEWLNAQLTKGSVAE